MSLMQHLLDVFPTLREQKSRLFVESVRDMFSSDPLRSQVGTAECLVEEDFILEATVKVENEGISREVGRHFVAEGWQKMNSENNMFGRGTGGKNEVIFVTVTNYSGAPLGTIHVTVHH